MKTKHIIYTLLFLLVLSVQKCQCKKDDPTPTPIPQPIPCDTCLPAITTTGQNTFGCRVNGKVWLPQKGSFQPAVNIDILGNQIGIDGYNSVNDVWLGMSLSPIYDTCYFKFPTQSLNKSQGKYLTNKYYITDTLNTGYIHFTRVDFKQGVFSGTFAFDTYSNDKKDTIHITDGRFDIHK